MNKIKFSHDYVKEPFYTDTTTLLEVFTVDRKDLHESFIKYDTEIRTYQEPTSQYIEPKKYYNLPNGKLLILLLHSFNYDTVTRQLWTTCRRWDKEKETYYRGLRGMNVQILRR